ncbi:MAG TPA: HlyD family efflux transporter periplasmic adaptor subunit, partial [Pseudomonadales bacterium]|nr:HlyD family efflux transporter periplasmic adaptor subunit [Pseudomonadales bacterium]
QQRLESADALVKKYQELFSQHYVAEVQVRQKQDEALAQSGDLQNLKRVSLNLERERANVKSELAGSRYKFGQQRAELERAISSVEQELTEYQAKRSVVITAPRNGTATSILVQPGQVASPQNPLLSILPEGAELQAHLLVPSRSIGFVAAGQSVALRYQAFPYQRFGSQTGTINAISKSLIGANEADFPVKLDEPAYRVVVSLPQQAIWAYQQSMPLQAGMLLDADIKLEQRRLIDWVFDPLYSLTGKL